MKKSSLTVRQAEERDQANWNRNVHHPLQTWEWGEFRKKMGIDVVRFVVEKAGKTHQCWQMTFHKVPFSPFTVGYFPKGPEPYQQMIDELMRLGKQKQTIYVQLEPNIEEISNIPSASLGAGKFQISNFVPSHHPLFTKYTFVLDLTKSEEELLKNMHGKTRYNIRLAQKHGVVVKEDSSNKGFAEYVKLSEETTNRQGFYAHNRTYIQTMWETMKKTGVAKLFTASYNHEILSAWIIFCWRDTVYYPYGASSRNHREVMAPNLLLWEIARWGKENGYRKFDLWGALGPSADGPDPKDPWYGFHRFKEGYGSDLVEFAGSYDLLINPILYRLYCISDTVRWGFLKLKK